MRDIGGSAHALAAGCTKISIGAIGSLQPNYPLSAFAS
jgi:hypothetical protein